MGDTLRCGTLDCAVLLPGGDVHLAGARNSYSARCALLGGITLPDDSCGKPAPDGMFRPPRAVMPISVLIATIPPGPASSPMYAPIVPLAFVCVAFALKEPAGES
jgi:hypothetical protein